MHCTAGPYIRVTSRAIEHAVRLAGSLGARISAPSFELDIRSPVGLYADPLHVAGMLAAERSKSLANARELVNLFDSVAGRNGVPHDHDIELCRPVELAHRLVEKARLCDLTLLGINPADGNRQVIAEELVFEAGRPVIIFPEAPERELRVPIRNVAVAWDASRPATRAVADVLPFLQAAMTVSIFTVVDEKAIKTSGSGAALSKHLAARDIQAGVQEIECDGRPIGKVFETYVRGHDIDLLVMGAYGHSRLKEFILGGATRSILAMPPTWVLLSH